MQLHTSVKAVLSELFRNLHKVSLGVRDLVAKSSLSCLLLSSLDLEIVVVKSDNVDIGESGDLAGWPTDTASDIENTHTGLEVHLVSKVVFVPGELWVRYVDRYWDRPTPCWKASPG